MVAQKTPAEGTNWVRWAVGILITLLVALNGWAFTYTVGIEHRVTKTEADLTTHLAKATEDKREINERLKAQDDNISKVLTGITTVQVDVATIKGYMERSKSKD